MNSKPVAEIHEQKEESFATIARRHGLSRKLISILSATAKELYYDDMDAVLENRVQFEEVAQQAVTGHAGNLELSFQLVDALANATEKLGLTRASDEPDVFRRVWIQNEAGKRIRGVVLRRLKGEVAIFCPPAKKSFGELGCMLDVTYRGIKSAISYKLQINDSVRLPATYVLHLTRPAGQGAIGRLHKRYVVNLPGFVHQMNADGPNSEPFPCKLKDISRGGVCLKCNAEFERGTSIYLEAFLEDGSAKPFGIECTASWMKNTVEGSLVGLEFGDLDATNLERLSTVLQHLQDKEE
ncbi:MAG: PilZ domain-containing protein [Planctomycetes bacterium]|nr:PilZ domain-containing protein [Planctomycetota bacterium]